MATTKLTDEKTQALRDELWNAVGAYSDSEAGAVEKAELANRVSALVGGNIDQSSIYVAKLTPAGLYNQVWQGKTISLPHELFVFLDQTANPTTVLKAVRDRLCPRPDSGFDAIVIGKSVQGGWEVHGVVEYEHSSIGEKLQHLIGKTVPLLKIADPALAGDASEVPATLPHLPPGAEGEGEISADEIIQHLAEAKNVVLEGPPGTGKTRLALQVVSELGHGEKEAFRLETILDGREIDGCAEELLAAPVVWEIIQLHPGFGYDEFVRGIRTDPNSPGFSLCSVDGVLPQMARVAKLREGKPTLLIIDEINRGNLSAILGETIFAIDPAHRGKEVRLQHEAPTGGSDSLTVPSNLFLLATMNSADRSIAMLDFAVRRRFRFVRVESSRLAVEQFYANYANRVLSASNLFDAFSNAVSQSELRPGHSYFLVADHEKFDDAEWAERLGARMQYELRPLFDEYRNEGILLGPVRLEDCPDLLALAPEWASQVIMKWLTAKESA